MTSQNHHLPENECDAITELIADYAFGLTDADETRFVEAGLPDCADARQQLAEYHQIQDVMREAAPQIAPPDSLRAKILAMSAPAAAPSAVAPAPAAPTTSPKVPAEPLRLLPAAPKKSTSRLHPAWMAAAAAFALLLITNVYWFSQSGTPESPPPAFALNSTAALRWVRMPAEAPMSGNVFLMWNESGDSGLMYAAGLPELSDGSVYELWLTRNGQRTSVGTFTVDDTGEAALIFNGEVEIDEYAWAWVTEELTSGEPQPAEIVVASGEL